MHDIKRTVTDYYTKKIVEHGPTAKGVDWNGEASQFTRFEQLFSRFDITDSDSVLDYGCGYGALIDYLRGRNLSCSYIGFDWASRMIEEAQRLYLDDKRNSFTCDDEYWRADPATYTVASGIFNVMIENSQKTWREYIESTLEALNSSCRKGFSFNMLTSYSDKEFMRKDLYYADPNYYFDLCKRQYSRHVALLHDYGLYEFTIVVKK